MKTEDMITPVAPKVNRRRRVVWADQSKITAFHADAKRLTEETGVSHEVDHIYPINGRTVSGLHTHDNLQVLTRDENRRKRSNLPGSRSSELWGTVETHDIYDGTTYSERCGWRKIGELDQQGRDSVIFEALTSNNLSAVSRRLKIKKEGLNLARLEALAAATEDNLTWWSKEKAKKFDAEIETVLRRLLDGEVMSSAMRGITEVLSSDVYSYERDNRTGWSHRLCNQPSWLNDYPDSTMEFLERERLKLSVAAA